MPGTSLQAALNATCDIRELDKSTGLALTSSGTGTPPTTVDTFAHGCTFTRTDGSAATSGLYQNTGTSAVPVWTLIDTALPGDTASSLIDTNAVTALDVGTTASAVNNFRVTNSAAGAVSANAVLLSAVGTDSAISIQVSPKGATGILTLGLATGTGDIVVGSSSAAQSVKLGNGAGAVTVNLGNVSVAGVTTNIACAVTGAGITDTFTIAGGNAAATGIKVVNILTGTPVTSGNNRLTMGGGAASAVTNNSVYTQYLATNRITGSANANAPTATLTDAAGNNITVQAGLRVTLTLAAGLQAGANTFNLNSHGTDSIKLSTNPATDLSTAYATGGVIDLLFNGTVWLAMGGQ